MSTIVSYARPPVVYCARCNEPFSQYEDMASTGPDEFWHLRCFVCAQCFRPFNDKHEYYEFGGRKYCEKDFRTLFAPCCSRCNQYIVGRFIRAINKCWHPNCFLCDRCRIPLADHGFIKSKKGQTLCHDCNLFENANTKASHTCCKCKALIDDQEPLRYKEETFHSYHFNCQACGIELRPDARQIDNDLFCLKCYDRMGIPICGACRKPIEERVVTALGKRWHVNCFACTNCEKPFLGKCHFEVKGLAYCERHYLELFGHQCNTCHKIIEGNVVTALGKYYCPDHFSCYRCHKTLIANKSKFFDVESTACCEKCYKKIPRKFRKQIAKQRTLDRKAAETATKS